MKKICITLCFCILFSVPSCDKNLQQEPEEYVEISLKPKGVDMEESPFSKASTSNDLYGLEIMTDNEQIYASWLTDDIASSSIRLLKGKTYNFHLMYVPDGKNILASAGSTYGNPFFHLGPLKTPQLGSINYGGNYDMNYGCYGAAQKKGKSSYYIQTNAWNDVDIYYGFKQVKAESDAEININLYRQMFGLVITATNFTRGTLHIYSGMAGESYGEAKGYNANIFDMTPSSPKLDKVLEMNYMPWCSFNIGVSSEEEVANWCGPGEAYAETLKIAYTTPDGETLELISQKFIAKRMTKYSVTIDVDELVQEYYSTLSATKIEDDWKSEGLEL